MLLSERFDEIARAVNNWGRWGDDDRIGTLNLLTPDAVRRGVEAVVDGRSFPLAVPLSEDGVQAGMVPGRDNPVHELFAVARLKSRMIDGRGTTPIRSSSFQAASIRWSASIRSRSK